MVKAETVLSIGLIGAIVIGGYILYKKFSNTEWTGFNLFGNGNNTAAEKSLRETKETIQAREIYYYINNTPPEKQTPMQMYEDAVIETLAPTKYSKSLTGSSVYYENNPYYTENPTAPTIENARNMNANNAMQNKNLIKKSKSNPVTIKAKSANSTRTILKPKANLTAGMHIGKSGLWVRD